MASNPMVKTVAKQLKYYFDVKRLEDGFDVSSGKTTDLNRPHHKARPALQYEGLHDCALKHYFSQPEVRAQLTRLGPADPEVDSPCELQIKKSIKNNMKKQQALKRYVPDWYHIYTLGGPRNLQTPIDYIPPPKPRKTQSAKGRWPVASHAPSADVPLQEADRLIDSASKLLAATTDWDLVHRLNSSLACFEQQPPSAKKPQSGNSKCRPLTARVTWDMDGRRVPSAKAKAYDDSYLDTAPKRSYLRRPATSVPKRSQQKRATSPPSPKPQSPSPESRRRRRSPKPQQGSLASGPSVNTEDDGVEEVKEGPLREYQVNVRTGDCVGASTTAAVYLTIYGEKGRTPACHLATSKVNKVKFQRGKEDQFVVKTHHVGQMRKIKIGHDRPQLSYAWYLESLSVHDLTNNQMHQFPCGRWLSGQDEDGNTYCTFLVSQQQESEYSDADIPVHEKTDSKISDTESNLNKNTGSSRRQRSGRWSSWMTTSARSQSAHQDKTQRKEKESNTRGTLGPEGQTKVKSSLQTYSNPDERGKNRKPRPVEAVDQEPRPVDQEYLAGYKAGLEAVEETERQRREEERMKDRQLLSGPSIHDACRNGDLEHVESLLHKFPEMKVLTDENGWTPLHLAASEGEVEIIKRLTSVGCDDLNVETPTGYTPTHLAAMNGHTIAVMVLHAMGASMDCKTADQQTPLHLASTAGHLECVKCLVANRTDLTAEDTFNRTPLDLADQYGQTDIVEFLQKCQQDLTNPSSTFAQLHQSQDKGGSQPQTAAKQNKAARHSEEAQKARPMSSVERRNKEKEEQALQAKRELYEEQHRHMEEEGVSFLDSIRQDFD